MTIALRKSVREFLKTQCDEVYYRRASKTAKYPRCVFSIDLYEDEGLQRGTLSVDVYDNQNENTEVETIVQNIRTALHRRILSSDKTKCACYYDRVLPLEDEDKGINRRQIQFELRVYEE